MSHFHRAAEVITGKLGLLGGNAASTFCRSKLGPLIPIRTLNGKFNLCNGKGLTFEDKTTDGGKRSNRDRIRIVLAQKASECSLSGINTWSRHGIGDSREGRHPSADKGIALSFGKPALQGAFFKSSLRFQETCHSCKQKTAEAWQIVEPV